jgi:hypothetical protein
MSGEGLELMLAPLRVANRSKNKKYFLLKIRFCPIAFSEAVRISDNLTKNLKFQSPFS